MKQVSVNGIEISEAPLSDAECQREFLKVLSNIDEPTPELLEEVFNCLHLWWVEKGPDRELMQNVCERFGLDVRVGEIYRLCRPLVPIMERLRKGESVRELKIRYLSSETVRCWWTALLIVRVLLKCNGLIAHARLLRWLGHQADCRQVRTALNLLNESRLVCTFKEKSRDPYRPVTWHRLAKEVLPSDL